MKLGSVPVVLGLGGVPMSVDGDDTQVLEVYVATETQDGRPVFEQAWLRNIQGVLCDVAGGCTTFEAQGAWRNPETRLVQTERTFVVRCAVSRGRLLTGLAKLRHVLVQYGRECEQHTVAFAIDGEMFGIDPSKPY